MSASSRTSEASRAGYPRPTSASNYPTPLAPPNVLSPLVRPPSTSPPPLPFRPPISLPQGWTSSSHVIPAAYPRRWKQCFGSLSRESRPFTKDRPDPEEGKAERAERNNVEARRVVRMRFHAQEVEVDWETVPRSERPEGLWIAGECWRREGRGGKGEGVTLVVTHANGFTKECWVPTIRRLLARGPAQASSLFGELSTAEESSPANSGSSESSGDTRVDAAAAAAAAVDIDEIWFLDDVHHGASIDLNAGLIGPVHPWSDGGRDILNLIQHVLPLPERPEREALEWSEETPGRKRKIIGVGHSFGANALVQAAHARPDLFHALFLAEPMCPPLAPPANADEFESGNMRWALVSGAIKRRGIWPDLASAASTRSSPFFASWDDEVWDLWLSHGIIPLEPGELHIASTRHGPVQLATPPWAEAAVFAEPTAMAEGWDKLAEMNVPVGFVMGGDAQATTGEENTREMVWRAPNAKNERIMDAGHLVVQEKPDELADALWRFIGSVASEIQTEEEPRARL